MIEQMSPLTRRIVAVGLLILVLFIALQLIVLPLAGALRDQRAELTELSARHARLAATAKRLLPDASTVPPGLAITAPDPARAGARLQALLAGSASIAGVKLDQTPPHPLAGQPRLIGSEIVVTGPEAGVANFVSLVEHGSPTMRFQHWQLVAGDRTQTPVRFTGLVVAAWEALP